MIKTPERVPFLLRVIRRRPPVAHAGIQETGPTRETLGPGGISSHTPLECRNDRASVGAWSITSWIPPWMFWMAMLLAAPQALCGGQRVDPALVPSMFAPESAPAHSISHLAGFVLAITGGMFALVAGLLIYVIVRYRRRPNDDGMEPAQVYGSGPVEAAWTTVPLLIVVAFTLTTARVIQEVQDAREPASAVNVQIIGHQWWWEIRYPELGIVTANELHVPVSQGGERRPAFLDLRSADVVHSFWVPRLMGKIDLVPNKVNSMWIEPERPGLFLGQCGTYCGTEHAYMLIRVFADLPQDFDRWAEQQKAPPENDPSAAAGRRVFERTACVNCHVIGGARDRRFGPDLTHLMSRSTLASGALSNSPAALRAWINSPEQFKPGVLMPTMNLSDNDLDKLVAYLSTLK